MKFKTKAQRRLASIATLSVLTLLSFFLYESIHGPETPRLLADKPFSEFLSAWQNNEVAILIRHTERCDRSSNPCLDGDNGITIEGKRLAQNIGSHLNTASNQQKMTRYNSPAKRAHQTAQFVFDGYTNDQIWLRKDCEQSLYKNILSHKKMSENLVLVTHSTCMKEFSDVKGMRMLNMSFGNNYGAAVFLKVDSESENIKVLGILLAGQWPDLITRIRQKLQ